MLAYLFRRLLQAAVVLWILTIVVFAISRLSGSPVSLMLPMGATEEQRQALVDRLGLDASYPEQYWRFFTGAVTGDFGESTRFHTGALPLVMDRLPNTVLLAFTAVGLAVVVGVTLGALTGLRRGTRMDHGVNAALGVGQAAPTFWIGVLLILFFGVKLQWLPFTGFDSWKSLVLPAVTLAILPTVTIARVMRSSVIGVLRAEYLRTARAKGLGQLRIVTAHVMRNALLPVITVVGLVLVVSLSGAVITEQIFSWPGVGALAITAIESRDYAVVQTVVMLVAVIVVLMNLLVDLTYSVIDPRVRRFDAAGS